MFDLPVFGPQTVRTLPDETRRFYRPEEGFSIVSVNRGGGVAATLSKAARFASCGSAIMIVVKPFLPY